MKNRLSIMLVACALAICAVVQAQEKVVNSYNLLTDVLTIDATRLYNNTVAVTGVATANDGTGGIFTYDGSSSTSTNSTNIFKPNSYAGRWIRNFGGGNVSFKGDGTVTSNNTQTVTGQGGLIQLALIPQTANTFLAGPASGAAAAPTYRVATLASADFVNQGTATTVLHGNAAGNPSFGAVSLTADVSGTLALASGGTGATNAAGARLALELGEFLTNSVIPLVNGGTGATNAAGVKLALGIQAGTCVTTADSTVTNTFATAFSTAPIVVTTPLNNTTATNTVVSITASNFVANAGADAVTLNWIAIGAP